MKILWVSDPPFFPSGYGTQTALITPRLQALGHEVIIFAPTYNGQPLTHKGVTVIGSMSWDLTGADMIDRHANAHDVDIIITMRDPWPLEPHYLRSLTRPWVPVVPIDTEPVSDAVLERLHFATFPLALTRNGQALLLEFGIPSYYTPLGVEIDVFQPGSKAEARQKLKLPPDDFIYLVVAQNNSNPSRKSLESIMMAYAYLQQKIDDAILYLHTDLTDNRGGVHLGNIAAKMDIPQECIRHTDQYLYNQGAPVEFMADLYRAADVLLNPAMGGGFEIPCVEMQACGGPVIACDWTAMRETVWAGLKLKADERGMDGEPMWNMLGGFRFRPYVPRLYRAMLWAYDFKATPEYNDLALLARAGALDYDIDHVVTEHWGSALAHIETMLSQGVLASGFERSIQEDADRLEREG